MKLLVTAVVLVGHSFDYALAFGSHHVCVGERRQRFRHPCSITPQRTFVLPVTCLSETTQDEPRADDTINDDSTDDDDDVLVLNFIQMVQSTPAGQLELDDIDLLREIMTQFSADGKEEIEGIETAQVVETLLGRLVTEWQSALDEEDREKEEYCRPTSIDFEMAIQGWENSKNPDKVVHVLSILSDQRELFLMGHTSLRPSLSPIKTILRVLASSRERGLDKRAAQVFESLEEFGLSADADVHGLMVSIVAKCRVAGAPERAESMLRDAVKRFPPGLTDGKFSGVSVDAFNAVVVAYAKSGREDGPKKAQELIAFMDQVDSENGSFGICSPNINTFTSLIDAYCQQNEWDSIGLADRMLNRLLEQYLEGNNDLEPNVATWTIVINAWGRLSKKNRRGAADRAGRLLRRMEDLYRNGRISCKPDAITYVTCMNAYAFARGGEDAGEAEKLLEEMNELYLDGDDSMKPSPRSVRIVADAWIKSGDMDSAESFLDDYENYLIEDGSEEFAEETVDMYRSILYGHSKVGNMERARFYLDYMIEMNMKPDPLCFDRLIEGYSNIGTQDALKGALNVFELMEKCRRKGDIKPNERVYTSFIRALTRCKAPEMHKKAETLLKRMHSLYEGGNNVSIKPTVFTYNAVLNACGESRHVEGTSHDQAFKTAVRVFNELRAGGEGFDHVTFGNMLRCANLLPEGTQRDKYVSATFSLCCQQGFVNSFVLRDLQQVVAEGVWRPLLDLPRGEPDLDHLPSSWSSRIPKVKSNARGGDFNRNPRGRGTNPRFRD
jgi:pentatricopeptide repeat protein